MRVDRELIRFLKTLPSGQEAVEAIRKRTILQLENPNNDPMVERIFGRINEVKGQVLDIGCYSGWLYHYLGKPKGYIGIDIWPEMIQVAKEFFPEGDFRCMHAMDWKDPVEFVWCSQLSFGNRTPEVVKHFKTIGAHGVAILRINEIEMLGEKCERFGHQGVVRW